jgi:hypothetical protein
MLAEEQAAIAYEEATDGCRRSVLGTRDSAPQWQRVKPDPELHPLSELDYEEGATWDEPLVTTPLPHLISAAQSLVLFVRPIERDGVAAM